MSETANYMVDEGQLELNPGRRVDRLTVTNTGDRAVQVGSHFHFLEVNRALRFDRAAAYGMRLNIPAGTAVRFEPGDTQTVELVEIGGERHVEGLNGLVSGALDDPTVRARALSAVRELGFHTDAEGDR